MKRMLTNSATWEKRLDDQYNYEVVDDVVAEIESVVKTVDVPYGIGIDVNVWHNEFSKKFVIEGEISKGSTWEVNDDLRVKAGTWTYFCIEVPAYDLRLRITDSELKLFDIRLPFDAKDDSSVRQDIDNIGDTIHKRIAELNALIYSEFKKALQDEADRVKQEEQLNQRRSELGHDTSWVDSAIRNAIQKAVDASDGLGFIDGDVYGYCVDDVAFTGDLAKGIRKAKKIAKEDPAVWEGKPLDLLAEAGQHKMITDDNIIEHLFESHGVQLPDWYFE